MVKYRLLFCEFTDEGPIYYSGSMVYNTIEQVMEEMSLQGACGYEEV